jgi:hypothetical protein
VSRFNVNINTIWYRGAKQRQNYWSLKTYVIFEHVYHEHRNIQLVFERSAIKVISTTGQFHRDLHDILAYFLSFKPASLVIQGRNCMRLPSNYKKNDYVHWCQTAFHEPSWFSCNRCVTFVTLKFHCFWGLEFSSSWSYPLYST